MTGVQTCALPICFPVTIIGVLIEGESIIENGVSLLGNSKIVNSHIKTNSVVEDSIVVDSDVGPMAKIRPSSELNKKI